MKRGALGVALLAAALASPAGAQQGPMGQPGPAGVPDVPSGAGVVRGQVVHREQPARAAGVEVVLYALTRGGMPGVRQTTTDASGRFSFEGVSNEAGTAYLLGARYAGLPFFVERFSFEPGETERSVEIAIADPSPDASQVELIDSRLRLEWVGGRLAVNELHRLQNRGRTSVYVPAEQRASSAAPFQTGLPEGARDLRMPHGVSPEGIAQSEGTLSFYGPIFPGEQEVSFTYFVPARKGTLELRKPLPAGAPRLVVQVPENAPPVRAAALRETETAEVDGRRYRQLVGERLAAGTTLAISVELPPVESNADALRPLETRIFLELDGAALVAREEHRFEVETDSLAVAPPGSALLRITLPSEATGLRVNTGAFDYGLVPSDGAAELLGPVPPGEGAVEVLYRVPAEGGATRLERRFSKPLELLSVFVADTGVVVGSDRLHRRRPIRTADRMYLHLEAFQIAADEPVLLTVTPLQPRISLPRSALFAAVGLAAVLAIALLTAPLRGGAVAAAAAEREEREDAAWREREAVYEAIRDLEHDFETGKVAEADYHALRQELRGRAVTLMREEQLGLQRVAAARDAAGAEPAASPPCAACGAEGRPGDRFCAACGARLEAAAPEERGASA